MEYSFTKTINVDDDGDQDMNLVVSVSNDDITIRESAVGKSITFSKEEFLAICDFIGKVHGVVSGMEE